MKLIFKQLLMFSIVLLAVSCSDDDNLLPGLWVNSNMIETFPGDTVTIKGQVSNEIGLSRVSIECENWSISKIYDLSAEKPKVFNYNYKFVVPDSATFNENLHITATDKKGTENIKTLLLTYKPDTEAPVVEGGVPSDMNVDYNTAENQGKLNLDYHVSDDRSLKFAIIEIPSLGLSDTIPLKGRTENLQKTIVISKIGSFPMTLTLEDYGGNKNLYQSSVVVMLKEAEDPISDYAQMYVVNVDEKETDYLSGYYRYMDRKDAYQYSCISYIPKNGTHLFFTPTKSLSSDKFGTSPYITSKLMNKNGYVIPVVVSKAGYYNIWIDIYNHKYVLTPFEPQATTYSGRMVLTGEGFSFGDWSFSPNMESAGTSYRKKITVSLNPSASSYSYCFTDGSWNQVWRNSEGKWWWLDDQNYGGTICTYNPGGAKTVQVTFDTAELWATIKKVN